MSTRTQFPNQFLTTQLPVLEALIFSEYDRHPDMIPVVCRTATSNKWGEQTTTVAGIKPAITKNEGEPVAYDEAIEGYDKTYTHVTYAIATSFSEELQEDDRFNLVEDTYRSLGLAMYQTRQITTANILNNGFSDTGPDGSTFFSTSHALIGGGTYANRPTVDVALSVAGLRAMEVAMMNQVNHRNINVVMMPKIILVSPALKHTAVELIKSQDRPDTAHRATNTFFMENYELVVCPFLTSETAWFALSDKQSHNFRFYERIAPSVKSWIDEETGDARTRIRSRFSVGYSDWIGAWGTSG